MLTDCPRKVIPPEAWDVFLAADLAKHGSWPASSVWLDNAEALVSAVRWAWAEDARYRAESGGGAGGDD